MELTMPFTRTSTDETLMETVQHGSSSYPFRYYCENLALFDFNCIEWHWHTELEFVYLEAGSMTCWIGDRQIGLTEGCGLFINSKILHRFYSPSDAAIPNFVFMPTLIAPQDSLIYQKYVLPVLSSSLSFQIFRSEVPWQAEALAVIREIIAAQPAELWTSCLIQRLWLVLYEHVKWPYPEARISDAPSSQARLQLMMQFIHLHYADALSLDAIAQQAMVSKSTALNLFQKYLRITPVNYLIQYRLKQAALLLSKTEKKINTISAETGFHNVDYFCRLFKRHYHVTPTEYRRNAGFRCKPASEHISSSRLKPPEP